MSEQPERGMHRKEPPALHWIAPTYTTDLEHSQRRTAVFPIGSYEQHGPHLPLITDTVVACAIARRIADAYDLPLLPPVTISCSHEHSAWAGTVSITSTTLTNIIRDVQESLRGQGIDKLVLLNAHGGNYVLSNIAQQANAQSDAPSLALYPGRDEWTAARKVAGMVTSNHDDMHAGELETSILLHVAPEMVRDGYINADHIADHRPHMLISGVAAYTESGVIGRPSLGTADKGAAVLDSLTHDFSSHLEILERQ